MRFTSKFYKTLWGALLVIGVLVVARCGDSSIDIDSSDSSDSAVSSDSGSDTVSTTNPPDRFPSISKAYPSEEERPACEGDQLSKIVYIIDVKKFQYCQEGSWTDIILPDSDSLTGLSSCTDSQVLKWNGSSWVCADDTDMLAGLSCGPGQVLKWNGSLWVCDDDTDTDTDTDMLADLTCNEGQVAKWSGSGWICRVGCPAGHYCPNFEVSYQSICSAGYFCPENSFQQVPCPAGKYCPTEGLKSADEATLCPAGKYCSAGVAQATSCPAGRFCPTQGLTSVAEATLCPVGKYCPTAGLSEATLCPAGSFCPTQGLSDATSCPAGSFCPTEGLSEATRLSPISAGANHTCALLNDGTVKCWGENLNGQLGNNKSGSGEKEVIPTATDSLGASKTAVQISAGANHTCALLNDGKVKCWGANSQGQLGDNTNTAKNTPIYVLHNNDGKNGVAADEYLSNVTQISVGEYHTCALLNDNTVKCWGRNVEGQLGNNDSGNGKKETSPPTSAISLGTGKTAVQISTGDDHTCALLNDGSVKCWGKNEFGKLGSQLGNGNASNQSIPFKVSSLTNAVQISTGGYHTCALLNDGKVKCWGRNGHGQLGDNTNNERNTPIYVLHDNDGKNGVAADEYLSSVIQISTGEYHTCALLNGGSVKCWGYGWYGQLGHNEPGPDKNKLIPTETDPTLNAVQISAGGNHTCALLNDGNVKCWGYNDYGQLGDNSTSDSFAPTSAIDFDYLEKIDYP